MIIACPNCSTRFEANAAAFPPAGRKVKCARCAHVWRQLPETAAPAAVPSAPPPPVSASAAAPVRSEAPPEMIWAGTDIPRRRPSGAAVWTLAAAAFAIVSASALLFRTEIANAVPAMGPIYAAIGLPVNTTGLALTIEAREQRAASRGVASTLVVTGIVANVTSEERPVPRISATLLSEDKRALHSWTFDPGFGTLKPGEQQSFHQELVQPPPDVYQVDAQFADGGG